jgi:hypothetical protein
MFVASINSNSISRIRFDASGNPVLNGMLTGNGLNGPDDVTFSPAGELFASNSLGGGSVSRFLFDASMNAIPNGSFATPQPVIGLHFAPVPEPGSLALCGFAVAGLIWRSRRRRGVSPTCSSAAHVRLTPRRSPCLLLLALGAPLAVAGPAPAQVTYNLSNDWSDLINPNGVWSYNAAPGSPVPTRYADDDPGHTTFTSAQPAWAFFPMGTSPGQIPWFLKAQSALVNPALDDLPLGRVELHNNDPFNSPPGFGTAAAGFSWTAPGAGTIQISGDMWQVRRSLGRTEDWALRRNGALLSDGVLPPSASITSSTPLDLLTGSGGAPALMQTVVAGDVMSLEFTRHSGESFGVTMGVDWTIQFTPVPEPGSLALCGLAAAGLIGYARRRAFPRRPPPGQPQPPIQEFQVSRLSWIAIVVLSLAAGRANAQAYSAVSDFSLAGNPNGAWSYGTLSSFTGGTFSLLTVPSSSGGFATWGNGGSVPNAAGVTKNTTSGTLTSGTVVLPPDLLNLDGENFIADVRWAAPSAGAYNVSGRFQRTDNGGFPVSVRIVQDGLTTLFSADNFSTFNDQRPFNLNVVLSAGSVLDFAEGAPQFNNDGTGLALTITPVPEPGSLALCGLAAVGGWLLRRKGLGRPLLAVIALIVLTTPTAARAQIVFSDGTFNDSDWTATKITNSIATISAQQQTTGGNPGAYRRVDHQNFNDLLYVIHLRSGAVVDPGIAPIATVNCSIDEIAIQNLFGVGVAVSPGLQQNGKSYFSGAFVNSAFAWQTFSASGLTAADFGTVSDVTDHPNFSPTGFPIQFGFVTSNNNGAPPFMASRAAGFDNWSFTVNPVPEPGSLALCGLAVAGIIWRGRRRHCCCCSRLGQRSQSSGRPAHKSF